MATLVLVASCSSGGGPPSTALTPGHASQRQEASLPSAREEAAAAAAGKLYLVGGYDKSGRDTSDVFAYDGGWQSGPRLPVAVDHPSAAAWQGSLVVAGGFNGGRAIADVYRLTAERWERLPSLKHARGALALVEVNGTLYAIGGNGDGGNIAEAEVLDSAEASWRELPPLPGPRNHLAGFQHRGMACAAGGRSPNSSRVDCYDAGARAWKRLADLPRATSGAGAAAFGDVVLVAGGEGAEIIDQLAIYRDGRWRAENMLIPRHGIQLAKFGNRLWACGGGTSPGLHAVPDCTSIAL